MKYGKWIGGIMGFMAMGPLGALAGFAIGSLFDKAADAQAVQGEYSPEESVYMGQRNSFLFSMLVMSSYIIRADGRIMHSEMEYVRQFLRANFGEAAADEGERILLNLFEQRKQMERTDPMAFRNTIRDCGAQIAANLSYEQRLQLLDFLVKIAQADGSVCTAEIEALIEKYIPRVEKMRTQLKKYNSAYKQLKAEVAALEKEVDASKESVIRRIETEQKLRELEELQKVVDNIPQEVLDLYRSMEKGELHEKNYR